MVEQSTFAFDYLIQRGVPLDDEQQFFQLKHRDLRRW